MSTGIAYRHAFYRRALIGQPHGILPPFPKKKQQKIRSSTVAPHTFVSIVLKNKIYETRTQYQAITPGGRRPHGTSGPLGCQKLLERPQSVEPNMANLEAVYCDEQDWRVDI
jgi:hypothetical protein